MKHISIISIILLLLSLLFGVGCGYRGNGKVIVERRELGGFNRLEIEQESSASGLVFGSNRVSRFHIKLIKDSAEYTSIEYDENLMHHIETETVNNRLIIHTKKALYSNRDIHINVHYKDLDRIDAASFAEIIFANPFRGPRLNLNVTGACDVKGEIFADRLNMDITGAADLELKGKVKKVNGDITGASSLHGFGLVSDTCILDITGAADARLHVLEYLSVNASGAADVVYKGSPLVEERITGAGEVRRMKKDTL